LAGYIIATHVSDFSEATGSIPLFLIALDARAEARNSISRLEPSISFEPARTAAENTRAGSRRITLR
jgi:hypothetical protein